MDGVCGATIQGRQMAAKGKKMREFECVRMVVFALGMGACSAEVGDAEVRESSSGLVSLECRDAAANVNLPTLRDTSVTLQNYSSSCGGIIRGLNPAVASVGTFRAEVRWAGPALTNKRDCTFASVRANLYGCTATTCRAFIQEQHPFGQWVNGACQVPVAFVSTLPPVPDGVKLFAEAETAGSAQAPVRVTIRAN